MIQAEIFEAIVFDMDGVVIDTRPYIEAFWRAEGKRYGIAITPEIMEFQVHGCPARQTAETLFPHISPDERRALIHRCEDEFELTMPYALMPGVWELLAQLRDHSMPVALVTSSLPAKVSRVFTQLDLHALFNVIVTADLVEKGKPDPACYRLAAEKLGKSPERCLAFEDAVSGLKAVVGAGMYAVGVGQPDREAILRGAGARLVIPNFTGVRLAETPEKQLILQLDEQTRFRVMNKQLTFNE